MTWLSVYFIIGWVFVDIIITIMAQTEGVKDHMQTVWDSNPFYLFMLMFISVIVWPLIIVAALLKR